MFIIFNQISFLCASYIFKILNMVLLDGEDCIRSTFQHSYPNIVSSEVSLFLSNIFINLTQHLNLMYQSINVPHSDTRQHPHFYVHSQIWSRRNLLTSNEICFINVTLRFNLVYLDWPDYQCITRQHPHSTYITKYGLVGSYLFPVK